MKSTFFATIGLVAFAACSTDDAPTRKELLFLTCASDTDCPGGRCQVVEPGPGWKNDAQHFCTFECTGLDSCQPSEAPNYKERGRAFSEGACAEAAGTALCLPACFTTVPGLYDCSKGVPKLCQELDDSHCAACGCPEGQVCDDGIGCIVPRALGEACKEHEQCASDNCSPSAKVCRVALYDDCTVDNCDHCMARRDGGPNYCTRDCSTNDDCDGHFCARPADEATHPIVCWPPCGKGLPPCDGSCSVDSGQEASMSLFGYDPHASCWCPTDCNEISAD